MPKKRDNTPAPDYAEFVSRLQECVGGPGASRSDFARKAGLVQGTFNSCFHGTEPDRRSIIKIARAAGVSAGYVVDGSDRKPSVAADASDGLDLTQFRKNLRYLLSSPQYSSRETSVSARTGLSRERLGELARDSRPSIPEIVDLAKFEEIHTLFTKDFESEDQDIVRVQQAMSKNSSAILSSAHNERTVVFSAPEFQKFNQLFQTMIKEIGSGGIEWLRQADASMLPSLEPGDIAIAMRRPEITRSGLYVLKNKNAMFVTRAIITPENTILLKNENPAFQFGAFEFDRQKYECVGPVVFRIIKEK